MKIGDKLICIDARYEEFFEGSTTLTVDGIVPAEDGPEYFIRLAEYGLFMFPETSFKIIPEGVEIVSKTPKEEVMEELQKWRDKLIDAENNDQYKDIEQCNHYLDFFLDKLLTIQKYDAEQAESKESLETSK